MTGPAITQPGVYDIPDAVYHADPVPGGSLSSSGARKLLPPSCPAIFKYEQDHPPAPKKAFDYGHAAHRLVLGAGAGFVIIDADNYQTKAARQARDEARANGAVPLLSWEYEQVQAMAAELRKHPVASALFDPARGRPEQSLFWEDGHYGIWRRARLDWLPNPGRGRLIIPDYKSCHSADLRALAKAVTDFGYHQQAAWYLDGVRALGLAGDDAAFVFVCQEKTPPFLVTIIELDADALATGRAWNEVAIERYRDCRESGMWPSYADGIELISLPPWAANRLEYA